MRHAAGPPWSRRRSRQAVSLKKAFSGIGHRSVQSGPKLMSTIAAAMGGVGLANVLSYQSAPQIANGQLLDVLADHAPSPMPVSLLYNPDQAAMPAVRMFIEAMRNKADKGLGPDQDLCEP